MEITVEMIISISTIIITYIFGIISKKLGIMEKQYIPLQNLLIGLCAGILCYISGFSDNAANSIIACVFSSLSAGGIYDLAKTKGSEK